MAQKKKEPKTKKAVEKPTPPPAPPEPVADETPLVLVVEDNGTVRPPKSDDELVIASPEITIQPQISIEVDVTTPPPEPPPVPTEPAKPAVSFIALMDDLLASLPKDLGWAFPTPPEYKAFLEVHARIPSTPRTEDGCRDMLTALLKVLPADMTRAFSQPKDNQRYAAARAAAVRMLPSAA